MRRIHIYRLLPTPEQHRVLRLLGDRAAELWNSTQYVCRQAHFNGGRVPTYPELCRLMLHHPAYRQLPSVIAQEVLKKVRESWATYFGLVRAHAAGRVAGPPGLPGYWKDRRTGHRLIRCIPITCPMNRSSGYRISRDHVAISLPRDLAPRKVFLVIRYRGASRYAGKQGRAEIVYDGVRRRWYLHVNVRTLDPKRPKHARRWAAIDRGARRALALVVEGNDLAAVFRMREAWRDYAYWRRRIAALQSSSSRRHKGGTRALRRLYAHRQSRLRAACRALARAAVRILHRLRVTDLAVDALNVHNGKRMHARTNELVYTFWMHSQFLAALEDACQRAGIRVHHVEAQGTSSHCPLCALPTPVTRPVRWRVTCPHGHTIHADVAGALNLLHKVCDPEVRGRAGGRPRWCTYRWNQHRWVPTQPTPRTGVLVA